MDQVITYNKTYQERYVEYINLLSGYEVLSASQIKKEWSLYLELSVDSIGWQALWKIPRLTCENLKISFPTVVLIFVQSVDYPAMEATVKVLAVQDDIHLPERHNVPLIQLWPTKEQDKTVSVDMETTSNAIDMLRFFYTNVFMPWDEEEDSTVDWLEKHLEIRLHLYFDLRNGNIPDATAEHVKGLLNEARRLQARYEHIVSKTDKDIHLNNEDKKTVNALVNIHLRMLQIRNEIEILENPLLRKALLSNQGQLQVTPATNKPDNWLVFPTGNVDDYMEFLAKIRNDVMEENVKFIASLALALENAKCNDKIFVHDSKHVLGATSTLLNNITLRGCYSNNETMITSSNEDIMLDCSGDVVLENLSLDISNAQYGIVVRSGTLKMHNCKIIGSGTSTIHQGIIVLGGSKLELIGCDITGFYSAISGNSSSSISIKNCTILDATIGLKMYDKCNVVVEHSVFQNCKDYGVCVETDNKIDDKATKIGDFALLQAIPDVSTNNVTGENNGKGDVVVTHKPKLEPIVDLFTNPIYAVINEPIDSDEDMDILNSSNECDQNNTIIKRLL